ASRTSRADLATVRDAPYPVSPLSATGSANVGEQDTFQLAKFESRIQPAGQPQRFQARYCLSTDGCAGSKHLSESLGGDSRLTLLRWLFGFTQIEAALVRCKQLCERERCVRRARTHLSRPLVL